MHVRDLYSPTPIQRRPPVARPAFAPSGEQTTLSAAAQLRQCPLGPQLSPAVKALSRQGKALSDEVSLCAGGPGQAATAQVLAQFRQGLCPYLAQATQNSPQDWSALDLLRQGLQEQTVDPVDFFHQVHEHYGPSVQVGDLLLETRPDVVQQILVGSDHPSPDRDFFTKSTLQKGSLDQVYGSHTLFLESDQSWRDRRALLAPLFLGEAVLSDKNHDHLQEIANKHLNALPCDGTPVDLNLKLRALSLDVALSHMFGLHLEAAELESMAGVFERGGQQAQANLLSPSPTEAGLQAELNRVADRLIASPQPGETLRALLNSPLGQDRDALRQEVLMLAMLGHETTANLLTWSAAELVKNPQHLQALRQEYAEKVGSGQPSYQQTGDLVVTRNVLKETARLHAPNYLVSREAKRDVDVQTPSGNLHLAAGTQILMPLQEVNRQLDDEESPAEWNPDRQGGRMYSFGGGHRVCMGQVLARLEAAVVLSQLMTRFELEPVATTSLSPQSDFSSRPGDAHFRIKLRSA